jgi:hypothetical protein
MKKQSVISGLDLVRYMPNERIIGLNELTLGDFWSWAYSVFSNLNQSVFAEFLVGAALGIIGIPRVEWRAYDFLYCGKKIEVKCAAYTQSWEQKRPSKITLISARKDYGTRILIYMRENRFVLQIVMCSASIQKLIHQRQIFLTHRLGNFM